MPETSPAADGAVVVHGAQREGTPVLEARRLTKHFPCAASV